MRLAALALLLAGCAWNAKRGGADGWIEVSSESFVLRTDLPQSEAERAVAELEQWRGALLAALPGLAPAAERAQVVELADPGELRSLSLAPVEGFTARDAFGQPLMVLGAGKGRIALHELTHVLVGSALITQPRWLQEGLAAYAETLRLDGSELVRGEARPERLEALSRTKLRYFDGVLGMGDDPASFSFQSAAWLVVHWMVDERPAEFALLLSRLARGENAWIALAAAFPGLHERALQDALRDFLSRPMPVRRFPLPARSSRTAVRALARSEVHALRAELFELAPAGRRELSRSQLLQALASDPGDPLALRLAGNLDAGAAIRAHPDDWRAWALYYDQHREPWAIEQAARLAPANPGVLYRLAIAAHEAGDRARALFDADRALTAGGARLDVLDVVAQIYAGNGRCADALQVMDRVSNAQEAGIPGDLPAPVVQPGALVLRCAAAEPDRPPPWPRTFPLLEARRFDPGPPQAALSIAWFDLAN